MVFCGVQHRARFSAAANLTKPSQQYYVTNVTKMGRTISPLVAHESGKDPSVDEILINASRKHPSVEPIFGNRRTIAPSRIPARDSGGIIPPSGRTIPDSRIPVAPSARPLPDSARPMPRSGMTKSRPEAAFCDSRTRRSGSRRLAQASTGSTTRRVLAQREDSSLRNPSSPWFLPDTFSRP